MNRIDIIEQKLNVLYDFMHKKLSSNDQSELEEAFARVDDRAEGYGYDPSLDSEDE